MGGVLKNVSKTVGDVTKELGQGAKLPKELTSLTDVMKKAGGDYQKISDALEEVSKQGPAMAKSAKTVESAIDAALKAVMKDDFGLDPKKPEDKKKLDSVRKELQSTLSGVKSDIGKEMTSFEKVTTMASSTAKSNLA